MGFAGAIQVPILEMARPAVLEWHREHWRQRREGKRIFVLRCFQDDRRSVEETSLLGERAVEAKVSGFYHIARNDLIMTASAYPNKGYELTASLLPQASTTERQRAWHFNLDCLTQSPGCKEICDVQPDSWKDFYLGRGRVDAAKYGERYAFCTDVALLK